MASRHSTISKATTEALATRLDVIGIALQEVARALAPAQAAQVANAFRQRVRGLADRPLTPAADEAITLEVAPLLAALLALAA